MKNWQKPKTYRIMYTYSAMYVGCSEYFTTEELNIEIQKTPENIRLIHINAVSLCKHLDDI